MGSISEAEAVELRTLGARIALLLHELDLPQHIKDLFVSMMEILDIEQTHAFAKMLEEALQKQLIAESNPVYQQAALEADRATITELQALKAAAV